jgi:hypothetical protein
MGAVARELGVKAPDISSTRASLVRKHIVSAPVAGQLKALNARTHEEQTERYGFLSISD